MKRLLSVMLLLFASCATGMESLHPRPDGAICRLPCGVEAVNLSPEECEGAQLFIPMYTEAIQRRTIFTAKQACEAIAGHQLIVVEASSDGGFPYQGKRYNGLTFCEYHRSYVGLPPGDPNSAAAHELTHVLDFKLRAKQATVKHPGWIQNGFCAALHDVSTMPDRCR